MNRAATDIGGERDCSLERCVRWSVFRRSLTLQASYNPQRMQNLGLLYAMLPWLRCSGGSGGKRRRFCRRHFGFFVTNPYFANFILGGLLRLEDENLCEGGRLDRTVDSFKDSLGRALASLGDQLFWLGLQPALLLTGAAAVLAGLHWAPVILLGIFAIAQIVLRYRSLDVGYRLGMDIVELLDRPVWHRAILTAKRAGMFAGGACFGLIAVRVLRGGADVDPLILAAIWLAAGAAAAVLRRRWTVESILLMVAPLALALAYI